MWGFCAAASIWVWMMNNSQHFGDDSSPILSVWLIASIKKTMVLNAVSYLYS